MLKVVFEKLEKEMKQLEKNTALEEILRVGQLILVI